MRNVTDRTSNPFGMRPSCERFVPGYGDANAHFHVVGDHPGVHGGADTGVPFTGTPAAERLQAALVDAGLLESAGDEPAVANTFLSYLHMCVPTAANGAGDGAVADDGVRAGDATGVDDPTPTDDEYADMERFFDAELRAIAAHVLLPVGERATQHVLEQYTARTWTPETSMDDLHGTELRGSGWLVVPVKDPREWTEGDAERLVEGIRTLRSTDYRRETDLGRFLPGGDPYLVR